MSLNKFHLFDLPPELIDEIIKHLDTNSMERFAKTCKFLQTRVSNFKTANPDLMARKRMLERAYVDDNTDDSDNLECLYDDEDLDDHVEDLDDLICYNENDLDRLSYGSNYDEDLDDYLHGS